ncbi:MAG: D-alanyl-D-alanine carboxypeptidase [Rickettsiales bacterium]|jgi:D-alanyl-D-alanine carboxypeptidase|nr:D-alanyl-D-alanine carboxypeptidase [Rickettsiales bacterium]
MKKLLALFSLFTFHFSLSAAVAAEYNAVLVADMNTGHVLYSERANDLNYPASLTKIMTLYLTFDAIEHGRLRLDQNLIVSKKAAAANPVKLGVSPGSKITVDSAIRAVAVHSANDVARVLAENLTGDEGDFSGLMTRVATEIGLARTNFENASGLPDDEHLSSARDIALLAMAVYKHFPQYWHYFSTKSFDWDGKTYYNTNALLGTYPGCDGMKTGYTNKSKYSLIATARRGNAQILSVVLGAPNKDVRAAVSRRMLDRGFAIVGGAPVKESEKWKVKSENNVQDSYHESRITNHAAVSVGNAGVQFGAFSSAAAAQQQQVRVRNLLGVETVLEKFNGMTRVRANGLSENSAQEIKHNAGSRGLDCYVFH